MTPINPRVADHPIDQQFLERWSPRAFTNEPISKAELEIMFEAARWAPSSYNAQPWGFIYALRDTPGWPKFLNLLIPFNQSWAKTAAALVIAVSKTTMTPPGGGTPVPSHSHSFDAGAAWAMLALQASLSGWHTHGMVGFDIPRATAALDIPADYRVEAAIAIGRLGSPDLLPPGLAAREVPSPRNPISSFAFEGAWPARVGD